MTADLRLSIGELGFAVGVASTLQRGLELISDQCGITNLVEAKTVLAASGHSLLARELASQGEREVKLAPVLRVAGEIIADTKWILRFVRTTDKHVESLLIHIASMGALADLTNDEYVHCVSPLHGLSALTDRICSFLELESRDESPLIRVERAAIEQIGHLPEGADIAAELHVRGVPDEIASPFAVDLATSRWRGIGTLIWNPKGHEPTSEEMFILLSGARTWLIATTEEGSIVLGHASRQRITTTVKGFLRKLDSTVRKFDHAGELDMP